MTIFYVFQYPIDCVIHIAALKAVGESMSCPIKYYEVNVVGSANLIAVNFTAELNS